MGLWEQYLGQRLYGRITAAARVTGYGFISIGVKNEILFSSYNMKRGKAEKLRLGDTVSFTVSPYQGEYTATEVELVSPYRGIIEIGDISLKTQLLENIRWDKGFFDYQLYKQGRPQDYINISFYMSEYLFNHHPEIQELFRHNKKNGQYLFKAYKDSCPLSNVIKVPNLKECYNQLRNQLFWMPTDGDPAVFSKEELMEEKTFFRDLLERLSNELSRSEEETTCLGVSEEWLKRVKMDNKIS